MWSARSDAAVFLPGSALTSYSRRERRSYACCSRGAVAARATLERAKREPFEPFNIGRAYVALREPDSAFAWLERSTWQWPHRAVLIEPALDPLRGDPRFPQLGERVERDMGLR